MSDMDYCLEAAGYELVFGCELEAGQLSAVTVPLSLLGGRYCLTYAQPWDVVEIKLWSRWTGEWWEAPLVVTLFMWLSGEISWSAMSADGRRGWGMQPSGDLLRTRLDLSPPGPLELLACAGDRSRV